jgi:hypothetical protein
MMHSTLGRLVLGMATATLLAAFLSACSDANAAESQTPSPTPSPTNSVHTPTPGQTDLPSATAPPSLGGGHPV